MRVTELPKDVFIIVLKRLKPWEILSFCSTCKECRKYLDLPVFPHGSTFSVYSSRVKESRFSGFIAEHQDFVLSHKDLSNFEKDDPTYRKRRVLWKSKLCNVGVVREKELLSWWDQCESKYDPECLITGDWPFHDQFSRDIPRTIFSEPFYNRKAKKAMKKILCFYCAMPGVDGYYGGNTYFVSSLLTYLDEREAFLAYWKFMNDPLKGSLFSVRKTEISMFVIRLALDINSKVP